MRGCILTRVTRSGGESTNMKPDLQIVHSENGWPFLYDSDRYEVVSHPDIYLAGDLLVANDYIGQRAVAVLVETSLVGSVINEEAFVLRKVKGNNK